jgi:nucleotide-binding universal stress UspA family protein
MTVRVGCIVEGHGEVQAVPALIRRVARTLGVPVDIPHPIRIPGSKLAQQGELERAVELASRTIGGRGAILVLLDSDDDCPAEVGPPLLARATSARRNVPVAVVLAKSEFEAWFLAAAESLRGRQGLAPDLQAPSHPEAIRGAKEWLRERMPAGRKYVETEDQAALTEHFDLDLARRRAASFDKCYREIARLLTAPGL